VIKERLGDQLEAWLPRLLPFLFERRLSPHALTAAGTAISLAAALLFARGLFLFSWLVEKIETAVEPKFQDHFVGAMGFPHATAPFAKLAAAVDLPAPKYGANAAADTGGDGRRRRRRRR